MKWFLRGSNFNILCTNLDQQAFRLWSVKMVSSWIGTRAVATTEADEAIASSDFLKIMGIFPQKEPTGVILVSFDHFQLKEKATVFAMTFWVPVYRSRGQMKINLPDTIISMVIMEPFLFFCFSFVRALVIKEPIKLFCDSILTPSIVIIVESNFTFVIH